MMELPTVMALEPLSALWPCLVVALVLTIYRILVDQLFGSIATRIAHEQITKSRPKFISKLLDTISASSVAASTTTQTQGETFDTICKEKELSDVLAFFTSKQIKLTGSQRRTVKSYHTACGEFGVKTEKFLEAIFKVSTVTMIACYGFYVVNIHHDFFINHKKQWPKYPDEEPYRQQTDDWLLWYYILSLGYHIQRTFFQWHNPGRKDFVALVIHHWSTIICLLFSYLASFLRTGALVIFIHENSDVFLESAKIANYCGSHFFKEVFFGLFVLSWFVMRIYAFSYKVLYEIWRFGSKQLWIANSPLFFNWTCVILLFVLEGLHLYWSTMICSMLMRKYNGQKLKDIRSGTESEAEPETKHD
eukprot:260968_1